MASATMAPMPRAGAVVAPVDNVSTTVTSRIPGRISSIDNAIQVIVRASSQTFVSVAPLDRGQAHVIIQSAMRPAIRPAQQAAMVAAIGLARNVPLEGNLKMRDKIRLLLRGASSITSMVPPRNSAVSEAQRKLQARLKADESIAKVERLLGH